MWSEGEELRGQEDGRQWAGTFDFSLTLPLDHCLVSGLWDGIPS